MRIARPLRALAVLAALLVCLVSAGCGGSTAKKKGGLTIGERLAKALEEKTPELQARELVKVARLQARSSDNSGAAKTLSEARGLLTPKPPKPAPPAATPDEAPESGPEAKPDSAPEGGAAEEKGEAAAGEAAPADGGAADAAAPAPDLAAEPAPPPEPEQVIDPVLAGPTLVEIAAVYALVGERTTAKDVLSQVRKLVAKIEDPVVKARMLADAGGIYGAKTGGLSDAANARRVLTEAATLANEIEVRFRPESLAAVTLGYVNAGLAKEAAATSKELEELARNSEGRPKAEGLAVAATVRGQTGDTNGATKLLTEAGEAAKSIDSPENRAYALMSVARATSAAGDRKAALSLIKAAEKSAQGVGDPEAQKTALEKVRTLQTEIEKRK